jgi:hypothetical protein
MAYVEADPAGTIACVRLDDVLANEPEIDVIKIDVEGWELEVLRGAGSLIRHHRPLLYVEITEARFAETRELLDRYGYVGWKRFNATPTFLFLPKERFAAAGT